MAPLRDEPPDVPLPDPDDSPSWYSGFWLQYSSAHPSYMSFGALFKAKAELAVILSRISAEFFGQRHYRDDDRQRTLALEFSARLYAWYCSLPESLAPAKLVFPSQLKLQ